MSLVKGSELIAITSQAVQPLHSTAHGRKADTIAEIDGGIFSPLRTPPRPEEVEDGETPSPLTINAGSLDVRSSMHFTEQSTRGYTDSHSPATLHGSPLLVGGEASQLVKVKVSSTKLREIGSPLSVTSSPAAAAATATAAGGGGNYRGTPSALGTAAVDSSCAAVTAGDEAVKRSKEPGTCPLAHLRQGLLQTTLHPAEEELNTSGESVVAASSRGDNHRTTRLKLFQQKSELHQTGSASSVVMHVISPPLPSPAGRRLVGAKTLPHGKAVRSVEDTSPLHKSRGRDDQENDLRRSNANLCRKQQNNGSSVGGFAHEEAESDNDTAVVSAPQEGRSPSTVEHSSTRGHSQGLSKHPGDKSHLKHESCVESGKKMRSPVTREDIRRAGNTLTVSVPSPVTHANQHDKGEKLIHYYRESSEDKGVASGFCGGEETQQQLKTLQHCTLNESDPTKLPGKCEAPVLGAVDGSGEGRTLLAGPVSDHVILETAKLVASCTAAATAAVLSSRDRPPGEGANHMLEPADSGLAQAPNKSDATHSRKLVDTTPSSMLAEGRNTQSASDKYKAHKPLRRGKSHSQQPSCQPETSVGDLTQRLQDLEQVYYLKERQEQLADSATHCVPAEKHLPVCHKQLPCVESNYPPASTLGQLSGASEVASTAGTLLVETAKSCTEKSSADSQPAADSGMLCKTADLLSDVRQRRAEMEFKYALMEGCLEDACPPSDLLLPPPALPAGPSCPPQATASLLGGGGQREGRVAGGISQLSCSPPHPAPSQEQDKPKSSPPRQCRKLPVQCHEQPARSAEAPKPTAPGGLANEPATSQSQEGEEYQQLASPPYQCGVLNSGQPLLLYRCRPPLQQQQQQQPTVQAVSTAECYHTVFPLASPVIMSSQRSGYYRRAEQPLLSSPSPTTVAAVSSCERELGETEASTSSPVYTSWSKSSLQDTLSSAVQVAPHMADVGLQTSPCASLPVTQPLPVESPIRSPPPPTSRHGNTAYQTDSCFQSVQDISSASSKPEEHHFTREAGPSFSLEGAHHPQPSPPSPPSHPHWTNSGEGETLSAEELDEKMRDHLKSRALEWVQRELMARLAAEVQLPQDPVCPTAQDESANSCSTCTPNDQHYTALTPLLEGGGMLLSVDAGAAVDNEMLLQLVRSEVIQLVRGMTGKEEEDEVEKGEASTEYSYTFPESGSPSSPPSLATPTLSPEPIPATSLIRQPTPQLSVATPIATPPTSLKSESEADGHLGLIATPQVSEDYSTTMADVTSLATGSIPSLSQTVGTPVATPTPEPASLGTTPLSLSARDADAPPSSKQQFAIVSSFSESCTTSSAGTPPQRPQLSTSESTTTDRDLSFGEYVTKRRPLHLANSSLSEGEVPLSPGDARWYTLNAGVAKATRQQSVGEGGATVLQDFVDLKNSCDPSASELSVSRQDSKPLSMGEVKQPAGRQRKSFFAGEDPFEKFLSKMDASTPHESSSSTETQQSSSTADENTLSEMPSIIEQDKEPFTLTVDVTPEVVGGRLQRTLGRSMKPGRLVKPVPVSSGGDSPGEVQRTKLSIFGLSKHKTKGLEPARNDVESSISYEQSAGEVPRKSRLTSRNKTLNTAVLKQSVSQQTTHSPGEVQPQRDGIDVINISKPSHRAFREHAPSPQAIHVSSSPPPKGGQLSSPQPPSIATAADSDDPSPSTNTSNKGAYSTDFEVSSHYSLPEF